MVKVFLVGHYGGGNTGDEAMLVGLLKAVRRNLLPIQFTVAVKKGHTPRCLDAYDVETTIIGSREIIRAIIDNDVVVLGGGTHYHDNFRRRRYCKHVWTMLRLSAIMVLAKAFKKRVLWLSVGIGPFYRPLTRWIAWLGMKACDAVVVRDSASLREMERLAQPCKITHAFDMAVLLRLGCAQPALEVTTGPLILGLSPKTFSETLFASESGKYFWNHCTAGLEALINETVNLVVRIFVFRGGSHESDWALCRQIKEQLARVAPGRVELVAAFEDPEEMYARIRECRAFVATRYHSAVLAYLAGCRLAVVPYHRKLSDFAAEVGLTEGAVLAVDASSADVSEVLHRLLHENGGEFRAKYPVHDAIVSALGNVRVLATCGGAVVDSEELGV